MKIPENFESPILQNPLDLPEGFSGKSIRSDTDIATYLMLQAGVVMVPGSGFGFREDEGVFRLSFSRLNEAVNIKEVLQDIVAAAAILEVAPPLQGPRPHGAIAAVPKQQAAAALDLQ